VIVAYAFKVGLNSGPWQGQNDQRLAAGVTDCGWAILMANRSEEVDLASAKKIFKISLAELRY
jgi:hypothetical protein